MSTPKWKKELRQAEQRKAKEHRQWQKKYGLLDRPIRAQKREFVAYQPEPVYRRETPYIPSSNSIPTGYAPKPERKVYTGDLIVGIATMHKSNAVPVMRGTSQAEDIAKMRRG